MADIYIQTESEDLRLELIGVFDSPNFVLNERVLEKLIHDSMSSNISLRNRANDLLAKRFPQGYKTAVPCASYLGP